MWCIKSKEGWLAATRKQKKIRPDFHFGLPFRQNNATYKLKRVNWLLLRTIVSYNRPLQHKIVFRGCPNNLTKLRDLVILFRKNLFSRPNLLWLKMIAIFWVYIIIRVLTRCKISFTPGPFANYYFGGARSKGFAKLRNVSKLTFFNKIGYAKSVGFRFYSAIWRSESRISSRYLEITSISLIYSLTSSRKKMKMMH